MPDENKQYDADDARAAFALAANAAMRVGQAAAGRGVGSIVPHATPASERPSPAQELAAARARVPAALAQLARLLRRKGLSVVGTELDREGTFADGLTEPLKQRAKPPDHAKYQ